MIAEDQPKIFKDTNLTVRVSSVTDGQMVVERAAAGVARDNINSFVADPDNLALIQCTYDRDSFDQIAVIDEKSTMWNSDVNNRYQVDALVTTKPGITLAVPVADCLCLVIFDPVTQTTAIAHLGRHGTVDNLTEKLISVMVTDFDCQPMNLLCYLSPSIKLESYGLDYFDYIDSSEWTSLYKKQDGKVFIDIPGYNYKKLIDSGVLAKNIEVSTVNTATNQNYGSHYIHQRVENKSDNRFLVTTTIKQL